MSNNYDMPSLNCDTEIQDPVAEYLDKVGVFREFGANAVEKEEATPPTKGERWAWVYKNDRLPSMADFRMANGNRLQFYGLEDDGLQSVLMVESGTCENHSPLLNIKELTGPNVTPLDVFWALSLPGTPVPMILSDMFVEPNGDFDCQQGWAGRTVIAPYPSEQTKTGVQPSDFEEPRRDVNPTFAITTQPSPAIGPDLACSNSWFTSSICGGFLSNNPFIRTDKTPNNYPYPKFQSDCLNPAASGQCWGQPRFKYRAKLQTTQSRVKICGRSVQNAANNHVVNWCGSACSSNPNCFQTTNCATYFGPVISCQYYWNGWKVMVDSQTGKAAIWEIPANSTGVLCMMWVTSQTTAHGVAVNYAKPLDEFDFLMDRPGGA